MLVSGAPGPEGMQYHDRGVLATVENNSVVDNYFLPLINSIYMGIEYSNKRLSGIDCHFYLIIEIMVEFWWRIMLCVIGT